MIKSNTYMTQFTCSHHGILINEKIITYLDAKGTYKNTCFLCEKLIQDKTPNLTCGRMYERVRLFSIQRNIGDFSQRLLYSTNLKFFLPTQLLQNTWKNHVDDVIHKSFECTPGDISTWSYYAKKVSFESESQLQNGLFDKNCTLSMEVCFLDRFRKQSM